MAVTDQLRERKKSGKRGNANVAGALQGLGTERRESAGTAEWMSANGSWVMGLIIEVTRRQGLVSFGLSRDNGAYMVNILLRGDQRKIWISETEDLDAKLEEIVHFLAALPD